MFDEIDYGPDENQEESLVIQRLGAKALSDWDKNAHVPDGWNVNPDEIIANWLDFANRLKHNHPNTITLIITSNGIARFAPHLTGDFSAFRQQHSLKIATGALSVFNSFPHTQLWHCTHWNIKPICAENQ
jgi:probable phosphoglycerate mutase